MEKLWIRGTIYLQFCPPGQTPCPYLNTCSICSWQKKLKNQMPNISIETNRYIRPSNQMDKEITTVMETLIAAENALTSYNPNTQLYGSILAAVATALFVKQIAPWFVNRPPPSPDQKGVCPFGSRSTRTGSSPSRLSMAACYLSQGALVVAGFFGGQWLFGGR